MTIETTRIPHDGGENPVREGETLVMLWLRGGHELKASDDGSIMRWTHEGNAGDIIAYAVTPERAPSPTAKAPTIAAVEAVARAVQDANAYMPGLLTEGEVRRIAEAALSAARPFIAAEWQEQTDDAIRAAYLTGASAVHEYWANGGTPQYAADFGEAASDYLAAIKETIR